jgi:hypothetical protein
MHWKEAGLLTLITIIVMSNQNIFQEKTEFPPFLGRVDKECKLILDAMMGFPEGTMMNNVVQNIFTQLESGTLAGIVLSKNFGLLKKLGVTPPNNLKSDGNLTKGIFAQSENSSKSKKFILVNSLEFKGQKNALIKYEPNNQEWRAIIAHEMTHIVNDCSLFFPSTKQSDSNYFVEFTEAFKLSNRFSLDIWQLFIDVCGELAARFTTWYIWEELFKKKYSEVASPNLILFFHRICFEVYANLATSEKNRLGEFVPGYYDSYVYLRYLRGKWNKDVLYVNALTQVCTFMEQIGINCRFFDANLATGIKVNKLFVDSASIFRKDVRIFNQSLLQLSAPGNGLH